MPFEPVAPRSVPTDVYEQIVTGSVVVIAVALDQSAKGWPLMRRSKTPTDAEQPTPQAVA